MDDLSRMEKQDVGDSDESARTDANKAVIVE